MVVKAADVWNWDWKSKKTVRCNYPGEQMSRGRLSWIPLKVLLYDDSVGVVTSRVTKMAVIPLDTQWPNPRCTQTPRLCLLYVRSYLRLKFFHCMNQEFCLIKNCEKWSKIVFFIHTTKLKHIF